MNNASSILAQPVDYRCPTCGKVPVHVKPNAPVVHHATDDHRLEAIAINGCPIWA